MTNISNISAILSTLGITETDDTKKKDESPKPKNVPSTDTVTISPDSTVVSDEDKTANHIAKVQAKMLLAIASRDENSLQQYTKMLEGLNPEKTPLPPKVRALYKTALYKLPFDLQRIEARLERATLNKDDVTVRVYEEQKTMIQTLQGLYKDFLAKSVTAQAAQPPNPNEPKRNPDEVVRAQGELTLGLVSRDYNAVAAASEKLETLQAEKVELPPRVIEAYRTGFNMFTNEKLPGAQQRLELARNTKNDDAVQQYQEQVTLYQILAGLYQGFIEQSEAASVVQSVQE